MNRKFLEELGLEKDNIDSIMAEHGKAIQAVKPADDYEELKTNKAQLEQQVTELQGTLESKETELNGVEDIKKELEKERLTNLKTSVAVEAGIPLKLAGRLSGATEEEIKADAESFSEFVNKKNPLPLKQTEPTKVDSEEKAYANMIDNLN